MKVNYLVIQPDYVTLRPIWDTSDDSRDSQALVDTDN